MGVKAGGEVQVSEHYMSIHVGVCAAGPGLELLNIKVGGKIAWRGNAKKNRVFDIVKPNLFGGNKKEGGVRGLAWWLNGNEKQVLPGPLWSRLGLTATTCPGFRGLASIFFTGYVHDTMEGTEFFWADTPETPTTPPTTTGILTSLLGGLLGSPAANGRQRGFGWTANNPYMKEISVRVRRAPQGLNPSIALIRVADDSGGRAQYGANPAHIVFEAMINQDWGMGEGFGAFDIGSFEQCAQTLYDEKFALNMMWTRQGKIEDFIKEVLDHIQGALFVNPATGKHTMKLLRAVDPDIPVPRVDPDNAVLTGFKMMLWGDISNEITVTWTNPESGKEETVTAQDLAAISMQGAQPASDSRNYYAIASQDLAISVAERDLAAVVHPIATCEAEVSKAFWKTVIYDVVELSWPERGIDSAFFRVSSVTAGTSNNTVKLSLYDDIFSLDRASYLTSAGSEWVNPSLPPEPLVYFQTGTAPAFMTAAALGLTDPGDLPYPEAISAITIGPDSADDVNYELMGYSPTVAGEIVSQSFGDRTLRGTWATDIVLPLESVSTIATMPGYLGNAPEVGQFVLIGMVADEATEIAAVRSVSEAGFLLDRGLLDTTPKEWPVGTRIWAIPSDTQVPDATRRAAYETASYHFLTRTSVGLLEMEDAPQVDILLSERPHLPNRPANVAINGVMFGAADFGTSETALVTWSRRNRLNESTQAMRWTDGDMAAEPGQTTRLYLMQADRTPIGVINGATGTTQTITRSDLAGNVTAIVRVVSVRDGLESLQGHEIGVTITAPSVEDIFDFSGDEAGNSFALSGDMAPGNLIV